jgi:hypothetical protein
MVVLLIALVIAIVWYRAWFVLAAVVALGVGVAGLAAHDRRTGRQLGRGNDIR